MAVEKLYSGLCMRSKAFVLFRWCMFMILRRVACPLPLVLKLEVVDIVVSNIPGV